MESRFRSAETLLHNTNSAALTLTSARVCAGALTTDRETTLVTNSTVAVNGGQPLHLTLLLPTEVTFDENPLILDHRRNFHQLFFTKFASTNIRTDACVIENLRSSRGSDAENVRERGFYTLLIGNVCAEESCYDRKCSERPEIMPTAPLRGRVLYQRSPRWQEEFSNFLGLE